MEQRDAQLARTLALPNGASAVVSASLDVGVKGPLGSVVGDYEFLLTTPRLTTAELPDAAMRYEMLRCQRRSIVADDPHRLQHGQAHTDGRGGCRRDVPLPSGKQRVALSGLPRDEHGGRRRGLPPPRRWKCSSD